ncbi:hypothetical protein BWI17_00800 [Betaproteobacteria bacterium GR16-43]|nr:hypothetical protein BWI17_00800 [Betaproteobacteria bacterium GR16-43]
MDPRSTPAAILVVDDRPDKILVFRSVLEDLGQEVVAVNSGGDALKQVLDRDFAVILLDVNMPGMDGFETAAMIRKRKRSSHTPIIFMTAYSDEMHAAQAYSLGAVDFILTPFAPEVLRAKVRVFVELHQMAEHIRSQSDQRIALAREQAARTAAEEAVRRSAFLAEGGRLLTSSLDPEALARDLSSFAVPFLGTMCVIALADEHQRISRTEIAWNDPDTSTGRRATSAKRITEPVLAGAIERAIIVSRREQVSAAVADSEGIRIERIDGTEERLALSFHPRTFAVYPLVARGRTLGAMAVALASPRERFTAAETALGEELSGRVGIALDNARLYLQVRDNDRRKDEFLAMLAHELRSPLAPIRNAIEVLRVSGTAEARLPWARDVIDRQSRQLMRIVDDLLDVSRITSGKIQLRTEDVDVGAVLASAVETSRPVVEERRHELSVTAPTKSMHVHGDFARIAQVLSNLLNNAAKYTPPGGRISVAATEEAGHAVFRVKDSGLGIPAPMLDGIFDLFTQLDTTLDRAQGGLGIGLTLVKRLVEAQGGRVEAASAGANQGSEFTVWLPLTKAPGSTVALPEPSKAIEARRILIVEDHADTAQTLCTLIRLDGHEVHHASDGFAALEIAPSFRPDVALVDIGLPGMDGFEIARRMRQLECGRHCLLVAVTGYGQERDRLKALEAGFDHHLVKPVNIQVLAGVIASRQRETETQ